MWLNAVARRLDAGDVCLGENDGLEGGARNVSVVECYVDSVVSGLCRQVGDGAGAVSVIPTVDCSFTRPFNRDSKTALAGTSCVNNKVCRPPNDSSDETWSSRVDPVGIASVQAGDSVRHRRHRFSAERYAQEILPELGRGEVDEEPFVSRYNVGLHLGAGRARDGHSKLCLPRALGNHAELLQTVHRSRCVRPTIIQPHMKPLCLYFC